MERWLDGQIGEASAVMRVLYRAVMVKRGLSQKELSFMGPSTFLPLFIVMNSG